MNADPRDGGFTLLEILVALAVLGFLVLGLTQGVRFGLLAWDRQGRMVAARGELDAIDRLLRRLVEQMDPGTDREPARIAGTTDVLEFRTDLGAAAGPPGARDADVRLTSDGGRLMLRWQPHRHAQALAPLPPPAEIELMRGIEALVFSYWGQTPDAPAGWRPAWREATPPALVRVRLRFATGDRRQWPDIVAAPMRQRPPG